MRRHLTLTGLCLSVLAGCGDARSHAELMADAAADVEAIEFERAMIRYDSARTKSPDDAEAHRQYARLANYFNLNAAAARAWERAVALEPDNAAAWEGYIRDLRWAGIFETDRRYSEKLLRVLPEALRNATDRPVIYDDAEGAAADLGQLEAYATILAEVQAIRPNDQILLHALGSLRFRLANQEDGDRAQVVRDSISAVLAALAAEVDDDPEVAAPVLYRLAAGYDFRMLRREEDADRWLERLEAAPGGGVLADDLSYWDMVIDWQQAVSGDVDEHRTEEVARLIAAGLKLPDLAHRGGFVWRNHFSIVQRAIASIPGDAPSARTVSADVTVAAEPPHEPLDPEVAGELFDAAMEVVRWRQGGTQFSVLGGLLYFGIEPQAVLGAAVEMEEDLRAHGPGYLYAGLRGDERERARRGAIDVARILQARALTQLGEIEAAGELFEQVATESRGETTLGEYGRHLLRTDRPAEALDAFVEAIAFGGSRYRPLADEAAAAADLSPETVEERLAARRPDVEEEMERRELGDRLEREAPAFALADQTGIEWRLSDLEGKIVVLKFWATWCGPCLQEFPHFVELLKRYEDDEDVVFLTVATAGSPRDEVARQIEEGGFTFPVMFDEQGLALDYEILGYPTTFYLDQAGVIQFKREGFEEPGYAEGVARRIDALRTTMDASVSP